MKIKLGDRVSHLEDERVGTVYSITAAESDGELFGISWDLNSNFNSVNVDLENISQCFVNNSAAEEKFELIKMNQLSPGISFHEAIRDRYQCDEEVEHHVGLKNALEFCKRISTLSLERMKVSFCGCCDFIKCFESSEELSSYFKNISSLCLNDNLISDWNSLFCILSHLPKLEYLTLNGNRFKDISCFNCSQFENIKVLSMSKTYVEIEKLMLLLRKDSVLPNINYVNLSSNNYTYISMNYSNQMIQKLDLSLNLLSDWDMIENFLTNLPGLTSLNISNNYFNKLPKIKINEKINHDFPNILELNLDSCGITELGTIAYLRIVFPNLEHLSLRNNKIMDKNQIDIKSIIISLLPNIKTFNRSIINKQDVVSYQRYYISQYSVQKNKLLKEVDPNGDIFCEFVIKNDMATHQDPTSDLDSKDKAEKYLDISFIPQFRCSLNCTPTRIKINRNMAVSDVKVLIWKIYKIQENKSLEYIFLNSKVKIKIDGYSDSHSLADLGIETNGKIYIQDCEKN